MIDDRQIQEAIAYYSGKVDPNRNDAVALAACYILQDHLAPNEQRTNSGYSYAAAPESTPSSGDDQAVGDYGSSDFLQAVRGKRPADVWPVMNDLMDTLAAVNPRVYDGVMRQIKSRGTV